MLRWLALLALACQVQGSAAAAHTPAPSRLAAPSPRAPSAEGPFPEAPPPAPSAAGATQASGPDAAPGRAIELAGAALHPGCIHELVQEVNGDLVVHSIHASIEGTRGCDDSNRYHQPTYWEGGLLWFDQTEQGDRFGYEVTRTIDRQTYLLEVRVQTSGTYASVGYLLVRLEPLLEVVIDAHRPVQRKAQTLTRWGEADTLADAELLVDAVMKLAPATKP